jgi:hypothetical protein
VGLRIGKTIGRITVSAAAVLIPAAVWATPSTTYWAPSVATCQPFATPHITYDTYYAKSAAYPIDTGLEIGIVKSSKVQAEVGYDALFPGSNPTQVYVNGKLCITENTLGKGAPAISFGMYNIGFKKDVTTYNVFHVMAQKTLPVGGYIAGGFYMGTNDTLFTNSDGEIKKSGAMIGWFSPDITLDLTGLKKLNLTADVQTGKNIAGGGGVGLYFYFTDYIDLLVGPVWYFDKALQPGGAKMLWTTQIDVDIPLGKKKP